ncbi:beta strand repeat-containing protein [Deinococcus roseus]|uniref:DUF1565 domain-containing protein n=1 Tax=Deinococcus roseus TaxID=392414 RepID=A0ABQ2CY23_9DEIO|nr:hypothetical protein [Deinococcus roseus]GGJ27452.1 hypothetical protein GCM10008938_11970 [Deinococcus roseus]
MFAPPASKPTTPPTQPNTGGMVEVVFDAIGTQNLSSKINYGESKTAVQKQAAGDLTLLSNGIQLKFLSNGYFDTDGTEVTDADCDYSKGARYLYVTYQVRNANKTGTAYNQANSNLTLVAVDANGSTNGTNAVGALRKFDNTSYTDPTTIANCIKPTHGMVFDPVSGASLRSNSADLQAFEDADLPSAASLGVDEVFNYGYVVRKTASSSDRILTANPGSSSYEGVVTFAVRLPKQTTESNNPYKFSLWFDVFTDSVTRVTESIEEQSSSAVQSRAALLGAGTEVQLLGGSTTSILGYTRRYLCDTRVAGRLTSAAVYLTQGVNIACFTDGRVYVDANTTNTAQNGRSWATAYKTLGDALVAAQGGQVPTEIWLADGVYYPDAGSKGLDRTGTTLSTTSDNAAATFYLEAGYKLYGGFSGNETTLAARNPGTNKTILSGDIDGNDTTSSGVTSSTSGISGSNSQHVVWVQGTAADPVGATTVLDGLTITGGSATSTGADGMGGGLYCDGSGSSNTCSPTLTDLIFKGNAATTAGGALFLNGDAGTTSPTVLRGLFSGNATTGTDTTSSTIGGGAVALSGDTGGVSAARFTNTLFYSNTSHHQGGAILVIGDGSGNVAPTFTNVTLNANTATTAGAGLYNRSATPVFQNAILWNNKVGSNANQVSSMDSALPQFQSSLVQGSGGSSAWDASIGTDLGSNLDQVPAFVNEASNDYRLKTCSPAVDAGDSSLTAQTTDYAGNNRFYNDSNAADSGNAGSQAAVIDLGALERSSTLAGADCTIIRVNPAATGEGSGATWNDGVTSLNDALYLANNTASRKEIWIKAGTYTPMDGTMQLDRYGNGYLASALDRNATFRITAGIKLYGGFAGTETASSQRNASTNPTILSADIDSNDTKTGGVTLTTSGISGSNSYHLLYLVGSAGSPITSSTQISGLTVTGGSSDNSFPNNYGAGFFCYAEYTGNECSPAFTDMKFYGNKAVYGGGAGYLDAFFGGTSSPSFTRVLFSGNATTGTNTSVSSGGGALSIHVTDSGIANPTFTNVVFYKNTSHNHGGGVLTYNRDTALGTINPTYTNVTFTKNTGTVYGGAMYNHYSTATVRNSILAGNSDSTGQFPVYNNNSTPTISYSVVERSITESGTDGGHNVGMAYPYGTPLFTDVGSGDVTLVPCSVATDAGDGSLLAETVDLNGNPRFSTDAGVSDSGNQGGQTAFVDIGAFERQSDSSLCDVIRVDRDATGDGSGSSWKNAMTYLPDALYISRNSGTRKNLWIADGVYWPDTGYWVADTSGNLLGTKDNNTSSTFFVYAGTSLYGGFGGTENALSERNVYNNITVLSADIDQNDTRDSRGITTSYSNISGSNSYHVLFMQGTAAAVTSSTVLSGLTVTAGNASSTSFYNARGGGLFCFAENSGTCSPTIKDVRFVGNSAYYGGGAVYLDMYNRGNSTATFTNVVFSQNTTTNDNQNNRGGGALFIDADTGGTVIPSITNGVFDRNKAALYGGAVHVYSPAANTSSPTFLNATFSGNTAATSGPSLYFFAGTSPKITSSVFWTAAAASGSPIYNNGGGITTSYSLIQNGFSGSTWVTSQGTNGGNNLNLTADPFVGISNPSGTDGLWATSDDGLYLSSGGTGVDSGSNSAVSGVSSDLTGATRTQGGTVDRGAYERTP